MRRSRTRRAPGYASVRGILRQLDADPLEQIPFAI
jgi:hypothetical protein